MNEQNAGVVATLKQHHLGSVLRRCAAITCEHLLFNNCGMYFAVGHQGYSRLTLRDIRSKRFLCLSLVVMELVFCRKIESCKPGYSLEQGLLLKDFVIDCLELHFAEASVEGFFLFSIFVVTLFCGKKSPGLSSQRVRFGNLVW